jgi:hypothetical protein
MEQDPRPGSGTGKEEADVKTSAGSPAGQQRVQDKPWSKGSGCRTGQIRDKDNAEETNKNI